MMKKIFLAILTMTYMTVTSGVAMEIHYCMGKKAGIDFYGSGNEKCGRCGMKEKKGGCCRDEHQFVKLSDSHKNVTNDIHFGISETIVLQDYPIYAWQTCADVVIARVNNHSPPLTGADACTLHCVFRL